MSAGTDTLSFPSGNVGAVISAGAAPGHVVPSRSPPLTAPPPITLIYGPTASGKSALALELAEAAGGVIVNADSQQLYADLEVLSARPGAADMARVDHRLYGVADAAQAWSAGRWLRAALKELARAEAEGRPVFVVGGTGLYLAALTEGLAEVPPVDEAVRAQVARALEVGGEAAFRAALAGQDPAAEARIAPGDRQRLVRAMAVVLATGRSLSDWRRETRPPIAADRWTALVLEPDRAELYARCDARVDAMLEGGAVEEVRRLRARGLSPDLPAMKAVGVRELGAWLDGGCTREAAVEAMKAATRRYAKRQLTWARNQVPAWPRLDGSGAEPATLQPVHPPEVA